MVNAMHTPILDMQQETSGAAVTGLPMAAATDDAALAQAWAVLESVPDPEIPVVSIRELGILRDVRRAEDASGSTASLCMCHRPGRCEKSLFAAERNGP